MRYALLTVLFSLATGCSLAKTRPTQEMSYTASAIHAAKEVQADNLAPELYRQSREWFFKARRAFKFKNYKDAYYYTRKARFFAEQAEFEAMKNGAKRIEAPPDPFDEIGSHDTSSDDEKQFVSKPEDYEAPETQKYFESLEQPAQEPSKPEEPKEEKK